MTSLPSYFPFEPNKIFQGVVESKIINLGYLLKQVGYKNRTYFIGNADFSGTRDLLSIFDIKVNDYNQSTGNYDIAPSSFGYHDKDLFYEMLPYECRGYQYVYMPPNYSMVVHKDISYLKCRLGIMLQGSAPILFYDEDHETVIDSYDYTKPVLTDVQVPHNVKNNDEYRLTFFINFEQEYDDMLGQMTNGNI